jgi:polyferredoxin
VQVCPTGIDIRKGLQYECIGCAACVDVCDGVMEKMNYAPGLIRFDTQNAVANQLDRAQSLRRIFRPRVLIYSLIMLLITSAFLASLMMRISFRVDVVRDRGALARLVEDGKIENVYRLHLMNAKEESLRFRVSVRGLEGLALASPADIEVAATESRWMPANVQLPPAVAQGLAPGAHAVEFVIQAVSPEGQLEGDSLREKTTFVIPR